MIELADQATDKSSPDEAEKAQKELRGLGHQLKWGQMKQREWWTREGLALEDIMSPESGKLDEEAIREQVRQGAENAKLTPAQRHRFERLAEDIIDRRKAIGEVREQAPTPEALYRFCFGRDPLGKVTVVEGPITLYFRCEDIDDYTLIFSQKFAGGEIGVTPEDRNLAARSGGVSISATRAYSPKLEQDPDLISPDGTPDKSKVEERSKLLRRLRGAVIAENNTIPDKFLNQWRVYRHEEQHAFKNIMNGLSVERRQITAAESLHDLEEAAETHEELSDKIVETIRKADAIREKGGDPEAEMHKYRDGLTELEKIQDRIESQLQTEVNGSAAEQIEAMAQDEILAYYLEGRLSKAVDYEMKVIAEPLPAYPDEPILIDLIEPYLKKQNSPGKKDALYDYHSEPVVADMIINKIVSMTGIVERAAEPPAEGESDLEKQAREKSQELKNDSRRHILRPFVHAAMTEHQARYHQTLDDAKQAIETLEAAGMKKQEIIDTLSLEPLRGWPRLAMRLTEGQRRAEKAAGNEAPENISKAA